MVISSHWGFSSPDCRQPALGGLGFVCGLEILCALVFVKSTVFPGPLVAKKVKLGLLHKGMALIQSAFTWACSLANAITRKKRLKIVLFIGRGLNGLLISGFRKTHWLQADPCILRCHWSQIPYWRARRHLFQADLPPLPTGICPPRPYAG